MKKIGVISIWEIDNYGNRLQNYAMLSVLRKFGYEANTIKLWPQKKWKRVIQYITNFDVSILRIMIEKIKGNRRKCSFLKFERKYITKDRRFLDGKKDAKYLNKTYDIYVLGSDQIWNPDFAGDTYYYGDFADEKNTVIAYAASIGVTDLAVEERAALKKGLQTVDFVSVREDRAADIIEEVGEKRPQVVLDPTMLLTCKEWETLEKKPDYITGNYILLYYLGELSSMRMKHIKKYAEDNDLDIIVIGKKEYGKFYATGPSEFVYLIHHARMVCTDSFHGCVFSILFHVPFYVFEREDRLTKMNSRLDTLLKTFEFENRKINNEDICFDMECDFKKSDRILEQKRYEANNYLTNALEIHP